MPAKYFVFHRLPTQEEVRSLFKTHSISAFCAHASFESKSEVKAFEEEENRAIGKHSRMHLVRLTPDPFDVKAVLAHYKVPFKMLGGLDEGMASKITKRLDGESRQIETAHDYFLEGNSRKVLEKMRKWLDFNARISIEGSKALASHTTQLSKSSPNSNFALVLDPAFENVLDKLRKHSQVEVVAVNPKQDVFNELVRRRVSGEKISDDDLMHAALWNVFSNYVSVFNLNEVDSERLAFLCLKNVSPIDARKICQRQKSSNNKQLDFVSSLQEKKVFLPNSREEAVEFLYKNRSS